MEPIQLISGYLDNELSCEQAEKLAVTLKSNRDAIDQLVMGSFIHAQLLDWMIQVRIADPAALAARDFSVGLVAPVARQSSRSTPLWSRKLLAAVLLIAAGLSFVTYVIASRPAVVAQLTTATDSRWGTSQAELQMGALLKDRQELVLEKGSALITFASGTQLLLEAPASIRLAGRNEVYLHSGRIAAKVPTQARGFAVNSSLAKFVDLGTQFTLRLDAEKSFQLHVFEGLVELQLDQRFGEEAHQPLRVAEVRAVSFNANSGEIIATPFEVGKQMPF